MKRLMGRHATREDEVDRMLRAGLFVDLYRVVRGGLRASVESYSIKELEIFYGFTRKVTLAEANSALYGVCAPLELGCPEAIKDEHRTAVEGYNRDDCVSTFQLRNWLEGIRQQLVDGGAAMERPAAGEGQASEQLTEWQRMIRPWANVSPSTCPYRPRTATLNSRLGGYWPTSWTGTGGKRRRRGGSSSG